MKVGIVRAVYGRYDDLTPLPPQTGEFDVEAVLVTGEPVTVIGWRNVVDPKPWLHPRMAAKIPKCRPDIYIPDADFLIWVDGYLQVLSENFAGDLITQLLDAERNSDFECGHVGFMPHPNRNNILDEAKVSVTVPLKYDDQDVVGQARHYRRTDPRSAWGLWASGLNVRRNSLPAQAFGDRWLLEQLRWTVQDQISLTYAAYQTWDKPPFDLRFDGWFNHMWTLQSHNSESRWGAS